VRSRDAAELSCDGYPVPQLPTERRSWRRILGLLLVSLAMAGLALWVLRGGALPVIPPSEAWAGVHWGAVAAYAGVWILVLASRSIRWVWLLRPHASVSSLRVTLVGLVGLGALVVFPMRLGEFVRPVLLRRHEPIPAWTALGTVGAERIIDGLFLSCLLLAALAVAPVAQDAQGLGTHAVSAAVVATTVKGTFAVFAAGSLGLVLAYAQRDLAKRVLARILRPVSARIAAVATETLERLLAGMAFLPHRGRLFAFVLVTATYWTLNALGLWLLAAGCGLQLTPAEATAVLGLIALGVLVPNAPGYFGVFQLSAYLGLSLYLEPTVVAERGAAFVVILYCVQIGGTLLAAGWAWLALRSRREPTTAAGPAPVPLDPRATIQADLSRSPADEGT
jgi:glycosyltransferase 2 family protein